MKSIMKSFNIENAVLPLVYSLNTITHNADGFGLGTNYKSFIKLEINKKYYTFYDNMIMAFKVINFVRFRRKGAFDVTDAYEVRMANGNVLRLNTYTDFYGCETHNVGEKEKQYKIFAIKDDILKYRVSQDETLIYNEQWHFGDICNTYFYKEFESKEESYHETIDYLMGSKRWVYYDTFFLKGYFLNENCVLMSKHARFKYFWVDECGGHYQVYDMIGDTKVYPSKKDALNTLKVCDFDDDNEEEKKEEVTIQMNVNKTDIWKVANKLKEIGIYINLK